MKKFAASILVAVMLISSAVSISAATYTHGNDNTNKKVFATTDVTTPTDIGAQITYQVDGTSTIVSVAKVSGKLMQAKSISDPLKGKSGWSFGYYWVNNVQTHQSTERMNFSF